MGYFDFMLYWDSLSPAEQEQQTKVIFLIIGVVILVVAVWYFIKVKFHKKIINSNSKLLKRFFNELE